MKAARQLPLAASLVALFLGAGICPAQVQSGNKEIARGEQRLAELRREIEEYETKFRESEKRERSTLDRLDNLERQGNLIRRLIKNLRDQELQISADIKDARGAIGELEQHLEALKSQYANYVRSVYKYGRVYDVELLFSSKSINQLYIRIEYLKRFSEQRAKDLRAIVEKKMDLEGQNDQLQANLAQQRKLLAEKTTEESSLKRKMSQRQKVLASIRKDKRTFQQAVKRGNESLREIEKMIADLVEKERVRKEREAVAARERERLAAAPTPAPEVEPVGAFASLRGRLRWPVSSGTISSRFGEHEHPILKTKTQNTGIDIGVRSGSDVSAVADGEVSIVTFVPGFGDVVILNHYNGYRTVYGDLAEISVVENQKVKAGETIGKSGESLQGSILHFEIWKDRDKQNPELWLAKHR
jgi:septal ring factor EnvC (AmiA/AmiB activator)